jgi:hypothetical protein
MEPSVRRVFVLAIQEQEGGTINWETGEVTFR